MTLYLDVPFRQKDEAKALGARWDPAARKWYAPTGVELALFDAWLPAPAPPVAPAMTAASRVAGVEPSGRGQAPTTKGIPLSQLLAGVAQIVTQVYKAGVWTIVEVVEARTHNGHVFLQLTERTPDGRVLAKADAILWASTANRILPEFERATGASLAPGIKLLVSARPVFKPPYGFSLDIDAIDPNYTLGDLEARKREIRARLQQDGVYEANRRLPAPWDYTAVLVVAPQGAAGLGDFQVEARRLERWEICRFVYAYSRFQGEGAAAEIRQALLDALARWREAGAADPDAVVIIRGGGAVNDLAWLNDYELAKTLCTLAIPVLTGIGHERDQTLLDEVAHSRFDTPSKVAAGIEQAIQRRVEETKAHYQQIIQQAHRAVHGARGQVDRERATLQAGAARSVAAARQTTAERLNLIQRGVTKAVHDTRQATRHRLVEIRHQAHQWLGMGKREVPARFAEIILDARNAVRLARTLAANKLEVIRDHAASDIVRSRESLQQAVETVSVFAHGTLIEARTRTTALFREIAGQGPEKTLGRGFAIVRDEAGVPLTTAAMVKPGTVVELEFRDGRVAARVNKGKQYG